MRNRCLYCDHYYEDDYYGIGDCMAIGGCAMEELPHYEWEDEVDLFDLIDDQYNND